MTERQTARVVVLSDRLVAMARACDRLRFSEYIVSWKYEQAMDEAGDGKWVEHNRSKMNEGIEALQFSLEVIEREFRDLLTREMKPYGAVEFDGSSLISPVWVVELFRKITIVESCYTKHAIQSLIDSGKKIVYWESGWNLVDKTFTVLQFPDQCSDSFIEVFWGIAVDYEAPSYLTPVTPTSWEVSHVEE